MTSNRLSRRFGEGREAKIGQAAPFDSAKSTTERVFPAASARFYEAHGFVRLANSMRLIIPMQTIANIIEVGRDQR